MWILNQDPGQFQKWKQHKKPIGQTFMKLLVGLGPRHKYYRCFWRDLELIRVLILDLDIFKT